MPSDRMKTVKKTVQKMGTKMETEMETETKIETETNSAEETYALGFRIGEQASAGEVYTLIGDLGVGKTVFTQGLAKGLGVEEAVNSPTFTILQLYEDGRLPFAHFDVYRIGDVEEMDEIGYEDYFYGNGVCLIEWAELIREILPEHYWEITICKDLKKGTDFRLITVEEKFASALHPQT